MVRSTWYIVCGSWSQLKKNNEGGFFMEVFYDTNGSREKQCSVLETVLTTLYVQSFFPSTYIRPDFGWAGK